MKIRPLVLAVIFATLAVIAFLMSRQPACEPGGPAVKGQVRRDSKGKLQYFDGQCWSSTPLPPGNQPF
jgi:hypothetical protein